MLESTARLFQGLQGTCPDGVPLLNYVLAFSTAVLGLHIYLDFRQRQALRIPAPPAPVADLYTQEQFEAKRAYNVARLRYSTVHTLWEWALNCAMLLCGWLPLTWSAAGVLLARAGLPVQGEVAQSVVWVLIQAGASLLLGLPWAAYSTFVLEAAHGFNKTSWRTFVLDRLKAAALGLALVPPLVAGLTAILLRASPLVGLHLWAFLLAVSLFMITIYPVAIAPLFNTFKPLEEGSLRTAVEKLAAGVGFPLRKLFVIDGSRRSAHSNAYMFGFGSNKRICLYDTLLEQCNEEQVVAVLAHELGHWKHGHLPKLLAAQQAASLAQLLLFTLVRSCPSIYEAFGFPPGVRPALGGLLLFQLLLGPVDEVLGLATNLVSRRFEFQADAFGAALGRAPHLAAALKALDKENKGAVNVDPLFSACHYSHPPLLERLAALEAAAKKAQ